MQNLHLPAFWQIVPYLVDEARRMAETCAMSYRKFCVGCALFAFNSQPYYINDFYKIFMGSNMKPLADGPNMCAEAVAAQAARHAGYELIVGVVIAGQPQEDHKSGLLHPTLLPCGNCRTFLSAMPEVRLDTEFLTLHLDGDIHQIHTFAEILAKNKPCVK
ncbi:MAG: hypothetical protein PHP25_01525 [Candidatus Moranbacteria bacterium]|nr:hypothetical protein [Candidatus Moranbacteria bacterium]